MSVSVSDCTSKYWYYAISNILVSFVHYFLLSVSVTMKIVWENSENITVAHREDMSNLAYHVSTVESTMSVKVLLRKSDLGFHCYVVNILLTSAAWSCWGKCWSLIFILFSCIHLLQFISSVNLQCSVGEECGLQHICVSLQRLLGNDLSMANHGEPGKCPLKCLCR